MTAPAASTQDSETQDSQTQDSGQLLSAEIAAERDHLAASREALGRMRDRALGLYRVGATAVADDVAAEVLDHSLTRRIAELADDPQTPLFFGRLSFGGGAEPAELRGRRYHIGRRHVTGDKGEPMVLDWRAPISRAFYQASAADPQGVAVRRRFGFHAGTLTGFEDEHLERGEELGLGSRILTAEVERPRIGPMRDIVATIQPDQDELVRADLAETICVQGAPGTGKTVVGLHRAAFLLYQHRDRLRRMGVLVVGPSGAFLDYISAVLPALGEVDVEQARVEDLVARVPVRATDDPPAAALKHDARMAKVIARALASRIARPTEEMIVADGAWRWRITAAALARIVDDVRREHPPYATGRERVRARVVSLLQRQAEARSGESPPESWVRRTGRHPVVRAFLDQVWPEVTPEELVFSLLRDAATLAAAADGILTADEQTRLLWSSRVQRGRPAPRSRTRRAAPGQASPPRTIKSAKWSTADALLIDEAAGLIERAPSLGHIVVDEAQDLSPMQCRAIARRSAHGSLTVLGDLAQGTSPWATRDWSRALEHLGKPGARVLPLTTGFRVPAAVLDLANRLLPALDVAVPAAVSLRRDGSLAVRRVPDTVAATVDAVRTTLAMPGSIGVIAADARTGEVAAALADAGIVATVPAPEGAAGSTRNGSGTAESDAAESGTAESGMAESGTAESGMAEPGSADERVTVLPATLAKGLEFDHVVVVEPAEIVEAEYAGLNRLYVVLTRAVSTLTVLHRRSLPPPL